MSADSEAAWLLGRRISDVPSRDVWRNERVSVGAGADADVSGKVQDPRGMDAAEPLYNNLNHKLKLNPQESDNVILIM